MKSKLKKFIPTRKVHFLNTVDTARMLGMEKRQVVNLIKVGQLREFRTPGGKYYRIHIDDIYRRLDTGKKVAIYLPIHRSQERSEPLREKAILANLNPVYLIEEHLPHTNSPLVWRDGWATATTMWQERKISGIVTHINFIGEVPNMLGWLIAIQRLGFFVYVDDGYSVEPYPYRVKEFEYIYHDPDSKRRKV
jgi:hypothetical protein